MRRKRSHRILRILRHQIRTIVKVIARTARTKKGMAATVTIKEGALEAKGVICKSITVPSRNRAHHLGRHPPEGE
uniref:Uncharacterized protein MANES_18G061400 n=1 Tax=Rhizophora mucronata TaxID=61149 RepID=A0A2P2PNE8_RHIMU